MTTDAEAAPSEGVCTEDGTCTSGSPEDTPPEEFDEDEFDNQQDDGWNLEEPTMPEVSDEVLLAELRAEQEEADRLAEQQRLEQERLEKQRDKKIPRAPIPGQLSPFQENIITTGSSVGMALLIVLAFMFVIKCFEILFNFWRRKAKLAKVKKALSTTHETSLEKFASGDVDRLAYVKYNSPFVAATEMDRRLRAGFRDKQVLFQLLQARALELVKRRILLMQEEQNVTRGFQRDLIPLEVWNDFLAAKESLGVEFSNVRFLCEKMGYPWEKLMHEAQARYNQERTRKTVKKSSQMRMNRLTKKKKQVQDEKLKRKEETSEPSAVSAESPGEPRRRPRRRGRMKFGKKTFS